MKSSLLFAMLAVALTLGPAIGAGRDGYLLQRGDIVKLSIFGVPSLQAEASVGIDGLVTLPLIGPIVAANVTLPDLAELVSSKMNGQIYRYINSDGFESIRSIRKEEVQLAIASYRPVAVYGAVATPGEIPFRPGMTVRSALAVTGFASQQVASPNGLTSLRAAELSGELRTLLVRRENFNALGGRLEQELGRLDNAVSAVEASDEDLPRDTTDPTITDSQKVRLQLRLKLRESQIIHLNRSINSIEGRLEILREREQAEADALEGDNDEKERVDRLFQRGIVTLERASDVRRAQLLSATRLLQTQDSIARSVLLRMDLQHELNLQATKRAIVLGDELAEARLELSVIDTRIEAIRQQLSVLGVFVAGEAQDLVLRVHRVVASKTVSFLMVMDDLLHPGDIVEVSWETME